MSTTICHYTDDFKRDAVQYVESHPEMTLRQAAEYLGLSKETLYEWIKMQSLLLFKILEDLQNRKWHKAKNKKLMA